MDPSLFVSEVSSSFICSICLNVIKNPIEHIDCETLFCHDCLSHVQEQSVSSSKCPTCRASLTNRTKTMNRVLRDFYEKLVIKCEHTDKGCTATFPWPMQAEHEANECQFNQFLCPHCLQSIPNKQQEIHEQTTCPKFMITCSVYGCNIQTERQVMDQHCRDCYMIHNELNAKRISELDEEVSRLRAALSTMNAQHSRAPAVGSSNSGNRNAVNWANRLPPASFAPQQQRQVGGIIRGGPGRPPTVFTSLREMIPPGASNGNSGGGRHGGRFHPRNGRNPEHIEGIGINRSRSAAAATGGGGSRSTRQEGDSSATQMPTLRGLVNRDGRTCHYSFDNFHSNKLTIYCGHDCGQHGYANACGRCDGRCGPNNGCQCKACKELQEQVDFRIGSMGHAPVNSEGAIVSLSYNQSCNGHLDGYRLYCGRMVGRENYHTTCMNCDGRCGPTNGCQCKACYELDQEDEEW